MATQSKPPNAGLGKSFMREGVRLKPIRRHKKTTHPRYWLCNVVVREETLAGGAEVFYFLTYISSMSLIYLATSAMVSRLV